MGKVLFKCAGHAGLIEVLVDRAGDSDRDCYRYRVGDTSGDIEIERVALGEGWLRLDGAVIPYHVVRREGRLLVWVAGRSYTLEVADGAAQRKDSVTARKVPPSERLTAPMPGMILKIIARAGDSFKAHQPLVIMESMKMELTLSMPHAGQVQEIACREGQLVELGALLVRLATAE